MGEKQVFQPLTREDTISVLLYRTGIVLATVIICGLAYLMANASSASHIGMAADILTYCLFAAIGMSVFFIHLYIGKFKIYLRNLYLIGLACFAALLVIGKGAPASAIIHDPRGAAFLLPLSGCLGFITAKEAFCFKLIEGYLLAMIMPLYLLLVSVGFFSPHGASYGLDVIAIMLLAFTARKVFMPLAYDIGDKSAYQ